MMSSADSTVSADRFSGDARRECELFAGLRIVVVASNCRAAVLRTLASARWLSMRGAEVMFLDTGSQDGSLEVVRARHPAVVALDVASSPLLLSDVAIQSLSDAEGTTGVTRRSPRWILQCPPGAWLDRFEVQGWMREIDQLPAGCFLTPRVEGEDESGAWVLARFQDLAELGSASAAVARFVPVTRRVLERSTAS
ncbi:MAG: hypothetical protein AAGG01_20500 [Planctomycetota bacterium]